MKYMAIIDADEKPVSCEFIGCNGNVAPYLIGATTNIKELEQEPKTGHWIDHQEDKWIYAQCSECETVHDTRTNYCPNCGARMFEPQESEDKE